MSNTRYDPALMLLVISLALPGCGGDLGLPSSSGEGVALSIVDGNGQIGTVGQELAEPLVVSVESGGIPVRGYAVAFVIAGDTGSGRLEPDTAVSDENGRAVARWVLGPETGSHEVIARLVVSEPEPPPTAVFEASAVAGQPDTMRGVSPLSQPGRRGQPVNEAPTVLVVDRFGNPVGGTPVAWAVTAGGGEVTGGTTTDEAGRARVTWTLGAGVGLQELTAGVTGANGSPVTFTATVLF
jgi:adhesin/invasin